MTDVLKALADRRCRDRNRRPIGCKRAYKPDSTLDLPALLPITNPLSYKSRPHQDSRRLTPPAADSDPSNQMEPREDKFDQGCVEYLRDQAHPSLLRSQGNPAGSLCFAARRFPVPQARSHQHESSRRDLCTWIPDTHPKDRAAQECDRQRQ